MKRTLIFLAAAALMFGWGCARVEENAIPEKPTLGARMTFTATLGDQLDGDLSDSKTALQPADENGSRAIWWTPGDAINIFYGSMSSSKFETDITEAQPIAPFFGNLGAATGASDVGINTQTFWGVYPYNANNSCDGDGVTLTIPGEQPGIPGGFADKLNPTVANSPGLGLSFYNVGSWFIFTVSGEGVTSLTMKGNNNEDIAGKIRVTMDANGKPVSEIKEGIKSITITPEAGGSFVPGEEYRIIVVPQTLSGGITLTLNNGSQTATLQLTSSLNFKRSSYLRKRNADSGLSWESATHQYVEMAPGFSWATTNVGAGSPEDYGGFFAWGEMKLKTDYSWGTYFDNPSGDGTTFTKYAIDKKTQIESGDDVATVNWGELWRMPTLADWVALVNADNFTWEWTTDYNGTGVCGYTVTSKVSGYVGNSIFLPAAGFFKGADYKESGNMGYYWSSSLAGSSDRASYITFSSGNITRTAWNRAYGFSIRPVYQDPTYVNGHQYVEMGEGQKWATTNVGAEFPEDFGDYFSWGETAPKSYYTSSNYNVTYFSDAAWANWGDKWRMPTAEDWTWLVENCTWTWTTQNGVNGYRVTSNVTGYTDKSIFLPAAGNMDGSLQYDGVRGFFWASDPVAGSSDKAAFFWLMERVMRVSVNDGTECYRGLSVRPVYDPSSIAGHKFVEMGDGLKWATTNVGASSPDAYGDLYAWGEIQTKTEYSWDSYLDSPDGGFTYFKYAADKKTRLDADDDVASVKWGGTWRTPTPSELNALRNTDNYAWAWDDTRKGVVIISKVSGYKGNSIFLPAAGNNHDSIHLEPGSSGAYWGSDVYLDNHSGAYFLLFSWSGEAISGQVVVGPRSSGFSVRAVSE